MKTRLLLLSTAALIFASCSTTIERNATAFGGGWGMKSNSSSSTKKEQKVDELSNKQINEEVEIKDESHFATPIQSSAEAIEASNFKSEVLYETKEFKDLNVVQKLVVKKAVKKIQKQAKENSNNAPEIKDASNATGIPLSNDEKIIAILLCFFLGGLGIHRFYLGYTTVGVLQLLTAGGCGIWVLIDFIRLIIGDLGRAGGSAAAPTQKSDNFGPMG